MSLQENVAIIQGEPIAQQRGRAIVAWLHHEEAIRMLLGGRPQAPGEDISHIEATWNAMREALAARSVYTPTSPVVEECDFDLVALAQNPHLATAFAQLQWTIRCVDLREVLGFQKVIKIDGLDERLKPVLDHPSTVTDFCIPAEHPAAPQIVIPDPDQMGFTVSSLNPNLRIAGSQIQQALVAPQEGMQAVPMIAVTFLVSMGFRYLQVVHYNGRCFLRDGYHRAAGLLRAVIYQVPCVFIEARNFEEVGADHTTMLGDETLFGDRPPFIADFWDESVSTEIAQPSIRRVVRVAAEQFSTSG